MKAAFAIWNDRLAPVFDVARRMRVVEAEGGRIVGTADEMLPLEPPAARALRLAERGAQVLVCGAISRPLQELIESYGIKVIPFVAGEMEEIVRAWLEARLEGERFAMPGCCGAGRGRGLGRNRAMRGMGRGGGGGGGGGGGAGGGRGGGARGGGAGGGRGGGAGGGGRGRMGGPQAGGPGGSCVCPQCGRREPHARGVPCAQQRCPQCGIAMRRDG